ncbi:MAG: holo-ACP synthase [Anaerolineales bacterium]|jgi:holo-[acyl-carrier protein] synthase|nr:holo-ACP synthase [Anaerolineales bacterium]
MAQILATGVDIIEINRIQQAMERHGPRFLHRIFTAAELEESAGSPASLAARFAAKEAVAKALGCGIGPVSWQEIEIRRGEARQPLLILHGAASEQARLQGLQTWSISLSHSLAYAVAVAAAIGG